MTPPPLWNFFKNSSVLGEVGIPYQQDLINPWDSIHHWRCTYNYNDAYNIDSSEQIPLWNSENQGNIRKLESFGSFDYHKISLLTRSVIQGIDQEWLCASVLLHHWCSVNSNGKNVKEHLHIFDLVYHSDEWLPHYTTSVCRLPSQILSSYQNGLINPWDSIHQWRCTYNYNDV